VQRKKEGGKDSVKSAIRAFSIGSRKSAIHYVYLHSAPKKLTSSQKIIEAGNPSQLRCSTYVP
jgi:hypothetical protein